MWWVWEVPEEDTPPVVATGDRGHEGVSVHVLEEQGRCVLCGGRENGGGWEEEHRDGGICLCACMSVTVQNSPPVLASFRWYFSAKAVWSSPVLLWQGIGMSHVTIM